jgi:pyruvate dehydrogenase E2 component (dihydrolipoamide acetyltransferase)
MVAAVRMRTPGAMFLSRGAASMRRPQVSYKFQEVMKYAPPT